MKLLNYTSSYFAIVLLFLITIWAGIFYFAMLDEIYDSIDDGLDNRKGLIIQKAVNDSTLLPKTTFGEGDFTIFEINAGEAKNFHDVYRDTLMFMQNEQDFEPVRLLESVFHLHEKYYKMQVITSMVEEDDLVSELLIALVWLYLGLIATILLLNNFLLKRIWRPFYHLLKQLKDFKLEKPSIEVKKTNIDEFRLLNEAVQKMLNSNISSYNSQKHFIENASHELQTPLAISINKLELLAEQEQLTEESSKLLATALDNLDRLSRLNKSLLLLSKIENNQYLAAEEININLLVKKVVADFEDQLSYSQISLNIFEEQECKVTMNPDLAIIFITNLIKNAIVHNQPVGDIDIVIKLASLSISNTGKDTALDQQNLFVRFNKDNQSLSSTGLGLSIVKAIADLYHFNLSYYYNGKHVMAVNFK